MSDQNGGEIIARIHAAVEAVHAFERHLAHDHFDETVEARKLLGEVRAHLGYAEYNLERTWERLKKDAEQEEATRGLRPVP